MIKLLIADDEPHFRDYMRTVLDWKGLGFEICAIAKNGEEALIAAQEAIPDIALIDINMPRMDGIALTERLKQISGNMLVVFITGYSEFEYTRKALQLGVDEYVLKPFSEEELTGIVLKLKLRIQKRISDEKYINEEKKIVAEELLKKLVEHRISNDPPEFAKKLSRVDITFPYDHFLVSVIEIDRISEMWTRPREIELWKFGISNVLHEVISKEGKQQNVFRGNENHIISILNFQNVSGTYKSITGCFQRVCKLIYEDFGFTVTIGLGNGVAGLESVSESYRNALAAVKDKFISGSGRVISYVNLSNQNRRASFYRLDLNDKLLEALRKNDYEAIKDILMSAKEDIKQQQLSNDYAYTMTFGMLSICLSYIIEMNCSIAEVLGDTFHPYEEMYNKQSLEDCFTLLEDIFRRTVEKLQNTFPQKAASILREVEEYIRQHYSDSSLTVESMASNIFFDASYIRRIFSRYMDCTISDYITAVRMKEARKLLEQQDLAISSVAEQVGYSDPGYFSKCFKKHFGASPREYINKL